VLIAPHLPGRRDTSPVVSPYLLPANTDPYVSRPRWERPLTNDGRLIAVRRPRSVVRRPTHAVWV